MPSERRLLRDLLPPRASIRGTAAINPHRVFWVATAVIAVDTLLFSLIVPALPVFADRFGLSDTQAALIFAAFPVAQLATAILAASAVDRIGRRRAMVGGVALLAVSSLVFALATGPWMLALARAAQGAAAGFAWTGAIAAISDVFPPEQLGLRLALAETAGGSMGLAGPVIGGVMIDAVGTGPTFAVAAALPVVVLVAVLGVPETLRPGTEPTPLIPALRRLARRPRAQAGGLALVLYAVVLALLEPLLPLDLDERLGLTSTQVGLVFAVGLLAAFVAAPLSGRWSDRRGRRGPLVVGGLLTAAALPFVAVGPGWWVAVAFALVGAGIGTLGAPAGPLVTEAVDEAGMAGRYGVSAGAITIVFAAGYAVGPLAGGAARVVVPFWVTVLGAAVVVALVTLVCARLLPRGAERPAGTDAAHPSPGPRRVAPRQ